MSSKSISLVKENDPTALLTVKQVAQRLAVSQSLVYEWADQGRLVLVQREMENPRFF